MIKREYSSGLVSQSFWFVEFKKVVKLVYDGMSKEDIRQKCIKENLFGAINEYRGKRMYGYIWNRISKLDAHLLQLFLTSDIQTQKLINLICILRGDRLFFEFIYEVYREKNILGIPVLQDNDVNIFFNNKEIQATEIAKLTDVTKRRLGSAYYNFMIDANLLSLKDKEKIITPPIVDIALERYLDSVGEISILKAITGVN